MAVFDTDSDPSHIAIVGAGICGAAAAIAFQQAGLNVEVFEQTIRAA